VAAYLTFGYLEVLRIPRSYSQIVPDKRKLVVVPFVALTGIIQARTAKPTNKLRMR